jgi:phospholipid transport system substrate-binding protein
MLTRPTPTTNRMLMLGLKAAALTITGTIILLGSPTWAGVPTDQIKETLDQVIKVLTDSTLQAPEKKAERDETLRSLVKGRLDRQELARRALGPRWEERSDGEKEQFTTAFADLLETTYLDKIDTYLKQSKDFSSDNIVYLGEKVGTQFAVVQTKVKVNGNTEFPVYYQLRKQDGSWLVCDIAIEGISIVKNYRVQFDEILTRSSFTDLLAQLEAKKQQH